MSAALSEAVASAGGSLDSEVIDYVAELASSVLEDSEGAVEEVIG